MGINCNMITATPVEATQVQADFFCILLSYVVISYNFGKSLNQESKAFTYI